VRVFFRLCPALTVSTAFDPNTTYRTFSDGLQFGHKIARLGRENNNILTIPFFATGRVTPGASMDSQLDATNVMTIPHDASGVEVVRYFGCWLDINQPGTQEFPLNPTDEGPYSGGLKPASVPVGRDRLRSGDDLERSDALHFRQAGAAQPAIRNCPPDSCSAIVGSKECLQPAQPAELRSRTR